MLSHQSLEPRLKPNYLFTNIKKDQNQEINKLKTTIKNLRKNLKNKRSIISKLR